MNTTDVTNIKFARTFDTSFGQALLYIGRDEESNNPTINLKALINGNMLEVTRGHTKNTTEAMGEALSVVDMMTTDHIEAIILEEYEDSFEEAMQAITDAEERGLPDEDTPPDTRGSSFNPKDYEDSYEGAIQAITDAEEMGLSDELVEAFTQMANAVKAAGSK